MTDNISKVYAALRSIRYNANNGSQDRPLHHRLSLIANEADKAIASIEYATTPAEVGKVSEDDANAAMRYIRDWCPDSVKDYVATLARQLAEADDLRDAMRAALQAAALPAVPDIPLNDDTKAIFGRMCFQCINLAQALRKAGHEIERGAEHEQAAVIHWMLNLYLKHGAGWREAGDAYLAAQAVCEKGDANEA